MGASARGGGNSKICLTLRDWHEDGKGMATALLAVCHALYPTTRFDLLAAVSSASILSAAGRSRVP